VRHVARDLAVRLEHADEGEDLQLADHWDVAPLLLRRHIRDVAAGREERVLALDDAKALHAVAEERGHRDAAVPGRDVSSRVQLTRGKKAELEFEFEFEFGNSNSNSNSTSANRTNSNSHELELEKLEEKCW
jgi:hypothetical protein